MKEGYRSFDLIGDVHGCASALVCLLKKLGYSKKKGVYQHPQRQVIFIGDIVDRGAEIREALHVVREMVEAGAARMVLGNHEYNSIAYCTQIEGSVEHIREHSPRNNRQIRETLDQFESYPSEWNDFLQWFKTLPLFLEMEHFRVVHACWDWDMVEQLKLRQVKDLSDDGFLQRCAIRGSFEWMALDRLLRGTYLRLPNDEVMLSMDGFQRHVYRTKFWSINPLYPSDVVFQPDPLPEHLANIPLTHVDKERLLEYGEEQTPLFIGHYWLEGIPDPVVHNIACLDYSAVKGGRLVAYRMDDELRLDKEKFIWVDVP
jgi:hypothetical protein